MRIWELKRGAPVTRVPCLKHSNEKPFGCFFKYCDAKGSINKKKQTKSPSYDGHIGILFKKGIKKEPTVNFEIFPNANFIEMPKDYVDSMNRYET